MQQPSQFQEHDFNYLLALIKSKPLGALILSSKEAFEVNHIPFVVDTSDAEIMRLRAHIPRSSPLLNLTHATQNCVVIFQGADGYISPSWYATKKRHGKVVPTWNYAVVHIHGKITVVDDASWVMNQLIDLTDHNEEKRANRWKVSDAPSDFTAKQLASLVGLEIIPTKIEAKTKASQNQPAENRESIMASLNEEQPESDFHVMMRNVIERCS